MGLCALSLGAFASSKSLRQVLQTGDLKERSGNLQYSARLPDTTARVHGHSTSIPTPGASSRPAVRLDLLRKDERRSRTDPDAPAVLGDSVQQLVVESHRSQQTRSLLPYNTNQVRTVLRESHSLSHAITETAAPFVGTQGAQPTQGVSAELTVAALALNRNKRGLYVYHQQRLDVLRDKFWHHGGVLSAAFGSETETRRNMTTTDEVFAKGYADLCLAFKTSTYGGGARRARVDDDPYSESFMYDDEDEDDDDAFEVQLIEAVDLLGGGTQLSPPKELMVDVRVLRDVGQVELLSGNRINLKQGLQYHLAREDVESMIVSGDVEVIE